MNSLLQQIVHQHLRRLLVELENEPSPTLNLATDLGLDSLELFELGASLEHHFSVTFPDEEIRDWRTLSDVYASLVRLGIENKPPVRRRRISRMFFN